MQSVRSVLGLVFLATLGQGKIVGIDLQDSDIEVFEKCFSAASIQSIRGRVEQHEGSCKKAWDDNKGRRTTAELWGDTFGGALGTGSSVELTRKPGPVRTTTAATVTTTTAKTPIEDSRRQTTSNSIDESRRPITARPAISQQATTQRLPAATTINYSDSTFNYNAYNSYNNRNPYRPDAIPTSFYSSYVPAMYWKTVGHWYYPNANWIFYRGYPWKVDVINKEINQVITLPDEIVYKPLTTRDDRDRYTYKYTRYPPQFFPRFQQPYSSQKSHWFNYPPVSFYQQHFQPINFPVGAPPSIPSYDSSGEKDDYYTSSLLQLADNILDLQLNHTKNSFVPTDQSSYQRVLGLLSSLSNMFSTNPAAGRKSEKLVQGNTQPRIFNVEKAKLTERRALRFRRKRSSTDGNSDRDSFVEACTIRRSDLISADETPNIKELKQLLKITELPNELQKDYEKATATCREFSTTNVNDTAVSNEQSPFADVVGESMLFYRCLKNLVRKVCLDYKTLLQILNSIPGSGGLDAILGNL